VIVRNPIKSHNSAAEQLFNRWNRLSDRRNSHPAGKIVIQQAEIGYPAGGMVIQLVKESFNMWKGRAALKSKFYSIILHSTHVNSFLFIPSFCHHMFLYSCNEHIWRVSNYSRPESHFSRRKMKNQGDNLALHFADWTTIMLTGWLFHRINVVPPPV